MLQNRVRIPSLVHHKPSGQARVRINGRDIYLGAFGSQAAEESYRREIAEWLGAPNAPQRPTEKTAISLNEIILAYFNFCQTYYVKNGEPTSELTLIKDTLRLVKDLYGSLSASEFGPLKLKVIREEMVRRGWERRQINRKVGRIRRMIKWAVENELVEPSVLQGLQAIAGLRHGRSEAKESLPVMPVADEDINAILPHVSAQLRDMIQLQLLSGCRPGEIVLLRPIEVNRDGAVWEYRPATHKTEHHGRQRVIFFGPVAQAILTKWMENRDPSSFCFSPAEATATRLEEQRRLRKSKVQPSQMNRRKHKPTKQAGERFTTCSYGRAIRNACHKLQITPWHPNQLRHSRATWLRRQFGLEAAQVILGHSKADVTQLYAERDLDSARQIMAEVG